MNLRTKILLVFLALALAPFAAASLVSYRGAASAVEAALRERADERVALAAGAVEAALKRHERALLALAESGPTGELVARALAAADEGGTRVEVPEAVRHDLERFLKNADGQFEAIAVLGGPDRTPLVRAVPNDGVTIKTENIASDAVRYDQQVWALGGPSVLRSQVAPEVEGSVVRLTAPVFVGGDGRGPAGALALEVKARALLAGAEGARPLAGVRGAARSGSGQELFAVENSTGLLVYHTNSALNHQPVADAMPSCAHAAERMRAGESGSAFYEEPGHRALCHLSRAQPVVMDALQPRIGRELRHRLELKDVLEQRAQLLLPGRRHQEGPEGVKAPSLIRRGDRVVLAEHLFQHLPLAAFAEGDPFAHLTVEVAEVLLDLAEVGEKALSPCRQPARTAHGAA